MLEKLRLKLRYDKSEKHYRDLWWKHFIRLFITYVAPLIILTFFFRFQYKSLIDETRSLHLKSVAEKLSSTLDLFLRERVVNLINIIDDPRMPIPPDSFMMQSYLQKLKKDSETFIDVGFFDSTGIQIVYAGPSLGLENINYSHEEWYKNLQHQKDRFIITDIYLGFRNKPHFTIAVKKTVNKKTVIIRASIDPKKLYEFISSQENPDEESISIVNDKGIFQIVTPEAGSVLEHSEVIPPKEIKLGIYNVEKNNADEKFAFAWLNNARWAVIVQTKYGSELSSADLMKNSLLFSALIIVFIVIIIVLRTKKLVQYEKEKDIRDAQLEHASKLASIGELSSGIAHEINNPLAIIASEVGLMKDLMNPDFASDTKLSDFEPHIENIREAAFRCRDITGKLLSFVRKGDVELKRQNIHGLLNEIVDDLIGHEMFVSNIEVVKNYHNNLPDILTDGNQLKQVFLNILNNAADAITPPGKIIITTSYESNCIKVDIADTGKGINQENIEKIFLPFFTTKEVGKGTGLGLSVSYGIIKNLGGKIEVKSIQEIGTTFTITLPKN